MLEIVINIEFLTKSLLYCIYTLKRTRGVKMKQYICIDIGGTEIKHGIIGEDGSILEKGKTNTEAWKGGPCLLDKAVRIAGTYLNKEVQGICVSTAGMVDVEKGEIFYAAPLIPDYTGTKIKARMEQEFSLLCEVENDVNCAGLAESENGAAKGADVALCLTVGTGIGGCILINGNVFHGHSNSACEVGYMNMDDSDFQTLGAASILVKKVRQLKKERTTETSVERKDDSCEEWNGIKIFDLAKQGDKDCIQAIDEMCSVLGKGIANICCVINPQVVVLGGGIMAQQEYLKERLEDALTRYLVSGIRNNTKIAFAHHRNDAGMLGAFYHFRKRHNVCLDHS